MAESTTTATTRRPPHGHASSAAANTRRSSSAHGPAPTPQVTRRRRAGGLAVARGHQLLATCAERLPIDAAALEVLRDYRDFLSEVVKRDEWIDVELTLELSPLLEVLRTLVALHRLTDDYIELFAGGGDSRAWPYLEDLVRFLAPLEVASVRPMFRLAWGFRARARLPPFEPPSVVHAMQCGRACNADLARTLPRYAIIEHYYPGATVMKIGGGGGGTEIIVDSDNANNNAATARVEYVGAWTSATATPGYHGTDYRYAATEPVSAPATFWFYLSAAGTRPIDAWWVAGTNRSAAATFTVHDASGAEVGRSTQNQQTAGSQWNALGTFAFTAGWNRVVLSRWQAAGSVVIADAIRAR